MGNLAIVTKWKAQGFLTRKRKASLPDYERYLFSRQEELRCALEGVAILAVFAYFFYRSLLAFFLLLPLYPFYRKERGRTMAVKRAEQLEKEFREALLSVNINLQAGYSMENAFVESYRDMVNLFGQDSDIARELQVIRRGMANGVTLERLLWDLGRRCPGGEIQEFAEVFSIAAKCGGRWQEMMKKTITIIEEKAEIKEEIQTMIHGKKTESRMMCLIPFFILFYMSLTSKGYFDVLYHNAAGIAIMTACLLLYCAAVYWTGKITEIKW